MLSIQQALRQIAEHVAPLNQETIPLSRAVGRVLAADVSADVDSPPHRKSVMDGFAVRSADAVRSEVITGGESESGDVRLKIVETIVAGGWPEKELFTGEAARIMTGAPLPTGADAVVMVELTNVETMRVGTVGESDVDSEWVVIKSDSIEAGKHVMERAANFATGETIFSAGHRVRPHDIGLMAEVGASKVEVYERPMIAILPTGDELVDCDSLPDRGQIRNSNGPLLISLAQSLGLETVDLGIGRDNCDELTEKIRQGLQQDLLILSGGVSAGILDLVPGILQQEGVTEIFHQVNIKPGKPIWFGVLKRPGHTCYVFGLPGNPVSSVVGFHLFVRAAIALLENSPAWQPGTITALLSQSHKTRGDRPTLWPGRWVEGSHANCSDEDLFNDRRLFGEQILDKQSDPARGVELSSATRWIEPLNWQGSSDLRTLAAAEGLIYFAGGQHQHGVGAAVSVYSF